MLWGMGMNFYTEAGSRIRILRELNHYSREQFAELVEISPKFLYEIETGRKGFSALTLYKIADALSVSSDYILTGKNESIGVDELQYLIGRFEPEQKGNVEKLLSIVFEMCERV